MAYEALCSIPDCGNPALARGWCRKHYLRWYKHGDPLETNGTERGSPLRFLQEIVLKHNGNECLPWPYASDQNGYGKINYEGRSQRVNGIVCTLTHGPAPSPVHEVAHSCGKGTTGCCAPRHLVWKTHAENEADKLAHGTRKIGERHGMAKLTDEQIRTIRRLAGTMPQREIGEMFGIAQGQVSAIVTRRTWAGVD